MQAVKAKENNLFLQNFQSKLITSLPEMLLSLVSSLGTSVSFNML